MYEQVLWPRSAWSIFDELETLQESMNQALNAQRRGYRRGRSDRYPLMNVWSSADGLVIDAELPGVNPDEVEISVLGDELTLSGRINSAPGREGEAVLRRERPTGEFTRTLQLPFRAAPDAVKAGYKDGVLRIAVPRSEEEKPRKISITAA